MWLCGCVVVWLCLVVVCEKKDYSFCGGSYSVCVRVWLCVGGLGCVYVSVSGAHVSGVGPSHVLISVSEPSENATSRWVR